MKRRQVFIEVMEHNIEQMPVGKCAPAAVRRKKVKKKKKIKRKEWVRTSIHNGIYWV